MSGQEKKQQRIYDLLNAKTEPKNISVIIGVSLWPPLSLDLNPLDYAIRAFLENKTNAISHPNISSLKTANEEEWNKKSEEFILKACKLFRRCVDTITEKKWWPYWVNLLFCVYLFCCLFSKIKGNLIL